MSASMHETQTATARQRATTPAKPVATPDYVAVAQQNEQAVLKDITSNPIYKFVIDGDASKEDRVRQIVAYLTAGLQDGDAKVELIQKADRGLYAAKENGRNQVRHIDED